MRKRIFCITILTMSLLIGASCVYGIEEASTLQDAFVKVSREAGPAVVSISTEHIERYSTRYYPFAKFEDEFFNEFFNDFFMAGPDREFKRIGLGSGVIIDRDGYVLTNEHVIHGADKITVTLPDGREFEGRVTGSDAYSDLAVVKIEPKGDLPYVRLGDSDNVQIGQWAIAIGNPFAFAVKNPEPTVTVGVISALHRTLPRTDKRAREYNDLIQTDAAINPGNSGGPLLNIYGEVIGINVAIFTLSGGSEGVGFAIPANTAKKIVNDLIEGRDVLHGWIGVVIQDITPDIANYFGLGEKQGILISRIVEKSPAEKAGLKPGDIIVSFDNEKIKNTQELIRSVLKKNVGEQAEVKIIREKKEYVLKVEIRQRPEEGEAAVKKQAEKASSEAVEAKNWRGIEVSEITPEMAQRFNIDTGSGVIVIGVEPRSAADEAGIRPGDLIYEINRIPIRSLKEYKIVISRISGDALVGTYRGYVVVKEK